MIIEYLSTSFDFDSEIVTEIDKLANENNYLKEQLKLKSISRIASSASVAITDHSSGVGSVGHHGSHRESSQQASGGHLNFHAELHNISSRVDNLAQDSLCTVVMLQGPAVDELLLATGGKDRSGGPPMTEVEPVERNHQLAPSKQAIVNILLLLLKEVGNARLGESD